jgi:1-acyl-sn-glycerol-3-phosphate acyltransferase
MSGRLIEIGLVPFGAFGMSVFGFDLVAASGPLPDASLVRVMFDLFALSLFGGFFIVPLYALIQSRSAPEHRSRILAANNIINALFVVRASGAAAGLLSQGISIPARFPVAVMANVAVAIFIFTLVPGFLMRFIVWMLIHTVYRLEIEGIEHVPDTGAVVVACNHVSFVDALIISAACPRLIRFVIDHRIYRPPLLHFVFRTSKAIPIAPRHEDAAVVESAFGDVSQGLANGDIIGIFPEGRLTGDGTMAPFRPGVEKIVSDSQVAVIPMALIGLWGSFFSRDGGRAMSRPLRLFRLFRSPITLRVGAPISAGEFSAAGLESRVSALYGE